MAGTVYQTEKDIVNKLSVLEYVVGSPDYKLYVPSTDFRSSDVISIQREAYRMLCHLDMGDYLAVISYTTEKPNVGGHIELNDADDSRNIFINISIDYQGHDAAVLCVMAHEICHKLLHIRKFMGNTVEENEVYTDLAAVYSGFGRLILNGCHDEWSTYQQVQDGTRETRHVLNIGYLTIQDYAYAYTLMGTLYSLSPTVYWAGLSRFAEKAMKEIHAPKLHPSAFDHVMVQVKQEYGDILRDINLLEDGLAGVKSRIAGQLAKYDYAPELRSGDGFTKPVTAYSLLLEPPLEQEADLVRSLRESIARKSDLRHLKTIFCPYCGKSVDMPSSLSDARYHTFKCFPCNKTFTVGMNLDESRGDSETKKRSSKKEGSFLARLFKRGK